MMWQDVGRRPRKNIDSHADTKIFDEDIFFRTGVRVRALSLVINLLKQELI
jgi:hypothetical protein